MRCLLKAKGQSIVEAILVVIVLITAIIVGGPYLLDSINGHYKLWDSGVADSINDHLIQAKASDLTVIPGSCTSKDVATVCGGACPGN